MYWLVSCRNVVRIERHKEEREREIEKGSKCPISFAFNIFAHCPLLLLWMMLFISNVFHCSVGVCWAIYAYLNSSIVHTAPTNVLQLNCIFQPNELIMHCVFAELNHISLLHFAHEISPKSCCMCMCASGIANTSLSFFATSMLFIRAI